MTHRGTVLIVDDDPTELKRTAGALSSAHFEILKATTVAEAVARFLRDRFDVAIITHSDINQRIEVCRQLRSSRRGRDLPVIIAVDSDCADTLAKVYEAGATDFIRRPLPLQLLPFRLRHMIRVAENQGDLRRTQDRLAAAHRLAKLGHWTWIPSLDRVSLSEEAARILGRKGACNINFDTFLDDFHDEDRHRIRCALGELPTIGASLRLEHRLADDDVTVVCQEVIVQVDGNEPSLLGTIQDISERKQTEKRIVQLAYYDNLTGLPNHTFFRDTVNAMMESFGQVDDRLGLVGVHISSYKSVVNTLGPDAGDHLLKTVAERLVHVPDETDTVVPEDTLSLDDTMSGGGILLSRVASDSFIFLFRDIRDETDLWRRARRVHQTLSATVEASGHTVVPGASLGMALYPEHGDNATTLIKNVETAQHKATKMGPGHTVMFDETLHTDARERMTLEMELRRAMEEDGFELHYQPKVETVSGRPVGMEALLRWSDPKLGNISPARFIPIAEEAGLIVPIGGWVLRTACRQALHWRKQDFPDFTVSVNISVDQFVQPDFVDVVLRTLTETGLPAEALELEITESMLMRDTALAVDHLTELRSHGVKIALDDFGTGYSSLSYLHRFPLDTLKIDRSFVTDMMHKRDSATIVRAIILLSHNLNLRVVAEGVEERAQLDELRKLGCEEIQGFFFSRPLPPAAFEQWAHDALRQQAAAVG